ncbi:MAG: tetratricopeptide repeat protein [Aureispira sp.]
MMKYIYIVALMLFGWTINNLQAQPQEFVDSLMTAFEEEQDSFQKSNYAYQIATAHRNSDPKKGLEYTKIAMGLVPEDSVVQLAQSYNMIGITYAQIYPDSLLVSIDYFKRAAVIFEANGYVNHVGNAYTNIAQAYTLLKDYEKAIKTLYKAQKLYEEAKSYENLGTIYDVLVNINFKQQDYEKGVANANKYFSFLLTQARLDSTLLIRSPHLLALAQHNLGLGYLKVRNLDSAEHHLLACLEKFEELKYENFIGKVSISLADTYLFKEELELARKYLIQGLAIEEYFQTTKQKMDAKNTLANLYHKLGQYDKSIVVHQEVLDVAQEEGYLGMELMALQSMAESYEQKGNKAKAYDLLRQAYPLRDSIMDKDRDQAIEDLEVKYATQYESEKKERENLLLSQKLDIQTLRATNREQLVYGILGLLFLIVVISVLVIRQNKIEATRRMQQLNYRLLLNQMSPHFIFNALTAIQSFVYRNDPRKAGKYLSSFAKLMRAILENSRTEYILLSKELQWLDNYLGLQALRFNNKFEYEVEIDEALDVDGILLPPMLTQPFIENAIEHGIKDLEVKGILTIQFDLEDGQLVVQIKDNGVGFDTEQTQKSNHISLATKITKERLSFLNQGNNKKIDFNISSIPNMGTAVSFSIPVQYS